MLFSCKPANPRMSGVDIKRRKPVGGGCNRMVWTRGSATGCALMQRVLGISTVHIGVIRTGGPSASI